LSERIDLLFGTRLRILRWARETPQRIFDIDQMAICIIGKGKLFKKYCGILFGIGRQGTPNN